MSRLRSLDMDNGSWLQVEPLNPDFIGKPDNLGSYFQSIYYNNTGLDR